MRKRRYTGGLVYGAAIESGLSQKIENILNEVPIRKVPNPHEEKK
jgi:hypothetical protein